MESYGFYEILDEIGVTPEIVGVFSMILGFILVFAVIGLILGVVTYILQAVGLYSMAKRRNIGHAWMAWIPMLQYWTAGSISDQYKTRVKGSKSYNRIIMLVLALVVWVISMASGATSVSSILRMVTAAIEEDAQAMAYAASMLTGGTTLLSLLGNLLNLALFVFWQITLYDIYSSTGTRHATLMLVLGIIFKVTIPFFLFCNRKKDEGMRIPQTVEPVSYENIYE